MFKLFVLDITLLISFPFDVSKPVRSTKARHPLIGGFALSGI